MWDTFRKERAWQIKEFFFTLRLLRQNPSAVAGFLIIALMALLYARMPTGYLPDEDQGSLVTMVQLPSGSTLEQTQAVLDEAREYFLHREGDAVQSAMAIAGATSSWSLSRCSEVDAVDSKMERRFARDIDAQHRLEAEPGDLEAMQRVGIGGVILFARNVQSPQQVAAITRELQTAALNSGHPGLFLAIDQEGGRVMRLRARHGFTELPPMRALGARGDEGLARQAGALLGRELRAVGIDLDYAPVVDVDTNPANPVIGDRSFSSDPGVVGRLGAALALGLQSAGVAACAKHFPGHGDTSQDSHTHLPRLPHALERLRRVELPPFAALARAGVASVMTAHVVFEALDAERPATLSAPVLRLLRDEVGFDGCCVSDDLEMKAVAEHFPLERVAPGCARAIWRAWTLVSRDNSAIRAAIAVSGTDLFASRFCKSLAM